jgi:hypothetical protein
MLNWLPRVALLTELIQHQFPVRFDTGWCSDDGSDSALFRYYIFSRRGDTVIAMIFGGPLHPWVETYGDEDHLFMTIARRYAEVQFGGSVPPIVADCLPLRSAQIGEAMQLVAHPVILVAAILASVFAGLFSSSC